MIRKDLLFSSRFKIASILWVFSQLRESSEVYYLQNYFLNCLYINSTIVKCVVFSLLVERVVIVVS